MLDPKFGVTLIHAPDIPLKGKLIDTNTYLDSF